MILVKRISIEKMLVRQFQRNFLSDITKFARFLVMYFLTSAELALMILHFERLICSYQSLEIGMVKPERNYVCT